MLVFLCLLFFSFGFLAIADEQEAITNYFEDVDQDGLTADEEKAYGTDPTNTDTDGDSYSDGVEIESGYDPLKPAPGDRVTEDVLAPPEATTSTVPSDTPTVNLTDIATEELQNVVQEKQEAKQELTNDDLNAAVAKVIESTNEEVELPEVNTEEIEVKDVPPQLSEDDKKKKAKEDTIQYLTTIGYIILSNAPAQIRSASDLSMFATQSTQNVMLSLATGNYQMLNDFKQRSERIIKEIKNVPVPEGMLGTHVKALKLVGFLGSFGDKIRTIDPTQDPIGQMAQFAKLQGGVMEMQNFLSVITQQLTDLGLKNMPLDVLGFSANQ